MPPRAAGYLETLAALLTTQHPSGLPPPEPGAQGRKGCKLGGNNYPCQSSFLPPCTLHSAPSDTPPHPVIRGGNREILHCDCDFFRRVSKPSFTREGLRRGKLHSIKKFRAGFPPPVSWRFFFGEGGRGMGGIAPSRTVTPANIHEIA